MTSATAAPADGPGRILAVASGKGGVGKTVLSVALAQALAEAGQGPVLLIDCDHGLANVDVQLGLDPAGRDIGAVLSGRLALPEAALAHPAGFHLLAGRSGTGAVLDHAQLGALTGLLGDEAAGGRWRYLVLDLAAGLDPGVRRLAALADLLLVVATDEPTSLTDAYAVLKLHRRDAAAAGRSGAALVAVNQAADRAAGERTWRTLDRACTGFLGAGVPLGGIIRRDHRVREAIRHQVPLLTRHPGSPAAEDVRRLAQAVAAASGRPPRPPPAVQPITSSLVAAGGEPA